MINQIFTLTLHFSLTACFKILDIFENIVVKVVPTAGASIACYNHGQNHRHCDPQSTNCEEANEMKRVKLLVDISVTPGPSGVVVSSTKVTNVSVTTSVFNKVFWLPAYCLLRASLIARKLLKFAEERILNQDSCDGTMDRKIISPKKRIKRSSSIWTLSWESIWNFLPNIWPFTLFKRQSLTQFELPEEYRNGDHLNNSRLRSVEKRKRTSSSTDYDNTTNPSPSTCAGSSKQSPTQNLGISPRESKEPVKENEEVAASSSSSPPPSGEGSAVRSLTKDLFDIEEDYKSADDPDYSPSEEDSSTTDSSEESLSEEHYQGVDNKGLALSPATSTTDINPKGDEGETNRRGSIAIDDEMGSPTRQDGLEPGKASAFDSPHSTTSHDDEYDDDIDS